MEPILEEAEVVEESEANPASQFDKEDEADEVNSPSISVSINASQLFVIPEDDSVDQYVLGSGVGNMSDLKPFNFMSNVIPVPTNFYYLLYSCCTISFTRCRHHR